MTDIAARCDITPVWDLSEADWLGVRSHGIGGSDLSSIAGVNKYKSAIQLWAEKSGTIESEKLDNEAIRLGNRFERPIAEEFADRFGYALVEWPVSLRLKSHPHMLANMDFVMVEPTPLTCRAGKVTEWLRVEPPPGILAIVEIKSTGLAGFGTGHQWGDDDDERMPVGYEMQVRHYQAVSGIHSAFLVGLLGGRGLQVRNVEWDGDYEEYIFEVEQQFWSNVVSLTPPVPDGSDSAKDVLDALYPEASKEMEAEGGGTLDLLWHDLTLAKEAAKIADEEKKRLRAQVVALLGTAEYGTVFGKRICSFKNSEPSKKFNEAKFKRENPEEYEKYSVMVPGYRTLRKSS